MPPQLHGAQPSPVELPGAGVAMSGQGRPFPLLGLLRPDLQEAEDLQAFASGPTQEARPSPGPWGPCPSRITDRNGAVWDDSFPPSAPATRGLG